MFDLNLCRRVRGRYVSCRYSQARKEKEAVRLLDEMVARGLEPERRALSSMIVAHSWGSVEDMRRCVCVEAGAGGTAGGAEFIEVLHKQSQTPVSDARGFANMQCLLVVLFDLNACLTKARRT